jgi:hypothetical protein
MARTGKKSRPRRGKKKSYTLTIEPPCNGRVRQSEIFFRDAEGRSVHSDRADMVSGPERARVARGAAAKLGGEPEEWLARLSDAWNETLDRHHLLTEQAAAGAPEAAPVVRAEVLDQQPATIARPLCLVRGRAYAGAWCRVRITTEKPGPPEEGCQAPPPRVDYQDVAVIVRDDGQAFSKDEAFPGALPLDQLWAQVRLPCAPAPGRGWSGAGLKRYLAGERPDPAEVFRRLVGVVDHFLDFARSLAPQETMCEMVACYALATWLLDAFSVIGYLWPNGEPGSGKTTLLQVVAQAGYLGELILAGSSYPTLRDLADYGACLAFDDAENVMDPRRSDPDKRTLLLAGNRSGATVAVKELQGDSWSTRHINTFCPRLFSAIRLPDPVLGSRSIVVPLVRSGDPARTKRSAANPEDWPCDQRRLVDDLWALGLAHLPELGAHDREAAGRARLAGRALEPWRAILAVAHWLQQRHGVDGLFERLEALSMAYQEERSEAEAEDRTRVLLRALLQLSEGRQPDETWHVRPGDLAKAMNDIATAEDLAEGDKPFTSPRRVGWLLKRQRFRKGEADEHGKQWQATRREIEAAARAHGVDVPARDEAPF